MTGAASCLAGFEGITVVIHGSSGCYYYPSTLLHSPLEGTFITENEVIFGSEDRLGEVIDGLAASGNRIAVVNTCVPSILGEDIRSMLASRDVLLVDSPGFSGDVEKGYRVALDILAPEVNPENPGVNIDGVTLFDPYYRGNVHELQRLFRLASIPVGTVFCADSLPKVKRAAPCTIGTNADFSSGAGEYLGGTLGFAEIRRTFRAIGDVCEHADIDPLLKEIDREEERVVRACDKFLRRHDPPGVTVFGGYSYALFAATTMKKYLDAEILCIGTRNDPGTVPLDTCSGALIHVPGMNEARGLIRHHHPDLVIGSSFEQSVDRSAGFIGIVPPMRDRVRLAPHAIAGIGGTLSFIEDILNECMDKKKQR
jgi:nitrogenase molybdenum-iron protein alpha/beta subunit